MRDMLFPAVGNLLGKASGRINFPDVVLVIDVKFTIVPVPSAKTIGGGNTRQVVFRFMKRVGYLMADTFVGCFPYIVNMPLLIPEIGNIPSCRRNPRLACLVYLPVKERPHFPR